MGIVAFAIGGVIGLGIGETINLVEYIKNKRAAGQVEDAE